MTYWRRAFWLLFPLLLTPALSAPPYPPTSTPFQLNEYATNWKQNLQRQAVSPGSSEKHQTSIIDIVWTVMHGKGNGPYIFLHHLLLHLDNAQSNFKKNVLRNTSYIAMPFSEAIRLKFLSNLSWPETLISVLDVAASRSFWAALYKRLSNSAVFSVRWVYLAATRVLNNS